MTTQKDLEAEVRELVQRTLAEGRPVAANWLTQELVQSHADISGGDADWYRCCAYGHVRAVVRLAVKAYAPARDAEADTQVLLPGFEHVQKAYLVRRDGEQTVVPIDQLTRDEILQKIADLETMASGCMAHAKELKRYLKTHHQKAR